jgi:glycosylphosphatidylinositol transamidase (GPIT) subunit GPI8
MLETMKREKKYRKLFFVMETCFSGSVAESCEGIDGVLMMTAANPYEPSKADAFDDELRVYLSNTFTASILSLLERKPESSIYDLYHHAFDKTNGSHVMMYNSDYYGNLYLNNFGEYLRNH